MNKNSKKEKINPIMTDSKKIKNIKMGNASSSEDDENIIKKFVIITIVIAILVAIVYGFTEFFKDEEEPIDTIVAGSINYDKVSVGTILNRPYDNYYVLVYSGSDTKAVLYSTIMTSYMQKSEEENYKKIYFCDLDNSLNKGYHDVSDDGISNTKATSVEDFDFTDLTLLEIKNGKIAKYIEDYEQIKEILK